MKKFSEIIFYQSSKKIYEKIFTNKKYLQIINMSIRKLSNSLVRKSAKKSPKKTNMVIRKSTKINKRSLTSKKKNIRVSAKKKSKRTKSIKKNRKSPKKTHDDGVGKRKTRDEIYEKMTEEKKRKIAALHEFNFFLLPYLPLKDQMNFIDSLDKQTLDKLYHTHFPKWDLSRNIRMKISLTKCRKSDADATCLKNFHEYPQNFVALHFLFSTLSLENLENMDTFMKTFFLCDQTDQITPDPENVVKIIYTETTEAELLACDPEKKRRYVLDEDFEFTDTSSMFLNNYNVCISDRNKSCYHESIKIVRDIEVYGLKKKIGDNFMQYVQSIVNVKYHLHHVKSIGNHWMRECNALVNPNFSGLSALMTVGGHWMLECESLENPNFSGLSALMTVGDNWMWECESL